MTRLALAAAICLLFGGIGAIAAAATTTSASSEASPPGIFWAQSPRGGEKEPGTIGRAELNGSDPQASFISGANAPGGVAISGDYVYWANYGSGTIGRANVDGSEVNRQFIKGATLPIGVAVADGHIYWSNAALFDRGDSIGRAKLNGSGVDRHFIHTKGKVTGLAVNSEHIYWTVQYWTHEYRVKRYAIGRASLDGADVDNRFINLANSTDGVAVSGRYVFWTNVGEHAIGRASLEGANVTQRCISVTDVPLENVPEGLAVNGQRVYWTNYPADTIARANLDGSEPDKHFLTVSGVPEGIAVDESTEATQPPKATEKCPSEGTAKGLTAPLLLGPTGQMAGPEQEGWGEVAPALISLGGASASGTISDIHWASWGGKVAVGHGLRPKLRPHGGYYLKPVVIHLRASRVGRCRPGGRPVYTRLVAREPVKPGGRMGKWFAWAKNMCVQREL
jgi:hypothetical protein